MQDNHRGLVERIVSIPILQAESALSVAIIVERSWFLIRRRTDVDSVGARLCQLLIGLVGRDSRRVGVQLL